MDLKSAFKLTPSTNVRLLALPRILMQVTGCMPIADGWLACLARGVAMLLLLRHVTALAAMYKCVLCKWGQGVSLNFQEEAPVLWPNQKRRRHMMTRDPSISSNLDSTACKATQQRITYLCGHF